MTTNANLFPGCQGASSTASGKPLSARRDGQIARVELLLNLSVAAVFLAPLAVLCALLFGQVTEISHSVLFGHSARKHVSAVGGNKSVNTGIDTQVDSSALNLDTPVFAPAEVPFAVPFAAPAGAWDAPLDAPAARRDRQAAPERGPPAGASAYLSPFLSVLASLLLVSLHSLPRLRRQSPGQSPVRGPFSFLFVPFEPAGFIPGWLSLGGRILALDRVRRGPTSVKHGTSPRFFPVRAT